MRRKMCALAAAILAVGCFLLPQALAGDGVVSANKTDPGIPAR